MIVDAHYHFAPQLEPVERLLSQMHRLNIEKVALIPALSEPFVLGPFGEILASLMRKMLAGRGKKLGLFMYRTTVTPGGRFSILWKTYRIYQKPDNDSVEEIIKKYPGRFLGWFAVNPASGTGVDEVEKRIKDPYWIGVKAHPFWHRYPVSALDDIARLCVERDLPLLIHLGGDRQRGDYKFLPERHRGLKIIYAHAGVPFFEELWEYIMQRDNLFIDLSSPYLDSTLRYRALKFLGSEKCIYGSDGPFGYHDSSGNYDHSVIIEEIKRSGLNGHELEYVFYRNFVSLLREDVVSK